MSAPSIPSLLVSHWQVAGTVDAGAAATACLYLWGTRRVATRWPRERTASFLAGVVCVVLALQSGIAAYDDRLLSVHMVQHMLLLLGAPLLLLGGRPAILALRALPARRRRALVAMFLRLAPAARPAVCLTVFSAVLVLTHLPRFYDATLRHPALHESEHALYLLAGLMLWWPLLDGDPVPAHRLGGLGRLVYLLATMPAMAIVGAYLDRHPTLVYPAYAAPARATGISAVVDQQQAGAIMWVGGSAIVIAVGLWVVIAALVAEERRQQARDAREAQPIGGSLT
jgi:cytochrome c oxidase assembly factor CtaG